MIKQILGKGSVYAKKNKYGNRYWYLEVRYLDENDEQHKKYIRGVTRRDAFANGDEFIQQTNEDIERINKNEASNCKNVSFNEFCADYLEKVCKRKVKDSTYLRYVTTFKKNLSPQLGDMLMKDISTFDIIDCINKLVDAGLSESTVKITEYITHNKKTDTSYTFLLHNSKTYNDITKKYYYILSNY